MSYEAKIKEQFLNNLIELSFYKGMNQQKKYEILKRLPLTDEEKAEIQELEKEIEKLDKIILELKTEILEK